MEKAYTYYHSTASVSQFRSFHSCLREKRTDLLNDALYINKYQLHNNIKNMNECNTIINNKNDIDNDMIIINFIVIIIIIILTQYNLRYSIAWYRTTTRIHRY